jgi:AdoMet-dependent heme synthase
MNIEKIEFQINNKCNMNCTFCFQKQNRDSNEINFTHILKSLNELKPTLKTVWITGGEPLLSEKLLFKIIKEAKKRNHYVGISSNGLLLNKFTEQLIKAGIDEVRVSFDSFNKQEFETIRGCPNSFEIVKQNIINTINKGIKISLRCTITNKNYNSVMNIINFAKTIGVKKVELKSVLPIGKGEKDLMLIPKALENLFSKATQLQSKDFEIIVMCNHLPRCKGYIVENNFSCKCANEFIYMYFDGSITPCSYFPKNPNYNIKNNKFIEVYNSKYFEDVRTAYPKECSICNHYIDCKNGCPAILFSKDKPKNLCYSVIEEL